MIERIRVQNYTNFGEQQTVPLEPITVIVGANNSGKTNFLRLVDFVRRDSPDLGCWHRPPIGGPGALAVEWDATLPDKDEHKHRTGTYRFSIGRTLNGPLLVNQTVVIDAKTVFQASGAPNSTGATFYNRTMNWMPGRSPTYLIKADNFESLPSNSGARGDFEALIGPFANARHVHLRVEALRQPNVLRPGVPLDATGEQLSATLASWVLGHPETMEEFNAIIERCIPEIKRVLVECPDDGRVRLIVEQKDGERFDASQVSDGVMMFAGLVAHALIAPRNALVLLEEPERAIHPRRLVELVDVLRTLVERRNTQFILATHSSALLNVFRDEPEAIVTFRRGATGTVVRRLTDIPGLTETLNRSDPGELLASGVFNEEIAGVDESQS